MAEGGSSLVAGDYENRRRARASYEKGEARQQRMRDEFKRDEKRLSKRIEDLPEEVDTAVRSAANAATLGLADTIAAKMTGQDEIAITKEREARSPTAAFLGGAAGGTALATLAAPAMPSTYAAAKYGPLAAALLSGGEAAAGNMAQAYMQENDVGSAGLTGAFFGTGMPLMMGALKGLKHDPNTLNAIIGGIDTATLKGVEPKETTKAYKLFRKKGDELFPLYVNADKPTPVGQWIDAEVGPDQGGKVKSKLGPLAMRPGWHAGETPVATHIGGKSSPDLKAPDFRPPDQVWAEVELPADVDWQGEATKRARITKAGKPDPKTAHITDEVPYGGHYRYRTNPQQAGDWLIGGSMKVNRVLDDAEVEMINKAAGVADLPRNPAGANHNPSLASTGAETPAGAPPQPEVSGTPGKKVYTAAEKADLLAAEKARNVERTRQLKALRDRYGEGPLPQLAERYPETNPRVLKYDKRSDKVFYGKDPTPEEQLMLERRRAAQAEIDSGNWQRFFDPEQRYDADASRYPAPYDTSQNVPPGTSAPSRALMEREAEKLADPAIAERATAAYREGSRFPGAGRWYAMGQMEDHMRGVVGPEQGTQNFRDYTNAMAATTGGNDPTSNYLMANYGLYNRKRGLPAAENPPSPIGGDTAGTNIEMFNKTLGNPDWEGEFGATNPKRSNFAANLRGYTDPLTVDDQMSKIITPPVRDPKTGKMPKLMPGNNVYGMHEQKFKGIGEGLGAPTPRDFQDVTWAGAKRISDEARGKTPYVPHPHIDDINQAFYRTSRITGLPLEEVANRAANFDIPLYQVAGLGAGLATAVAVNGDRAEASEPRRDIGVTAKAIRDIRRRVKNPEMRDRLIEEILK